MYATLTQKIVLPSIVVSIGMLAVLAYVFESKTLHVMGYATAAAPLPIPFTDARGLQESFAHTYTATMITDAGEVITLQPENLPLTGPHKRKIPYLVSIIFSPKNNAIVKSVITYGFCSVDRPLATSVGVGAVSAVNIHINSNTPENPGLWSNTFLCLN